MALSLLQNPEETERYIRKKFKMSLLRFHQVYEKKRHAKPAPKPKAAPKNQIEKLLKRAMAL